MDLCDKLRDVILTGYVDGEIDKEMRNEVEQHLISCPSCRALVRDVKETLLEPLRTEPPETVPEHVWTSIKERIEAEERPTDLFQRWLEAFSFRNIAPAVGVIVLLVLVGSSVMRTEQIKVAQEKEQVEYLVSLVNSTSVGPEPDISDLGTSIEEYFL